jgi:hypothetical protein
MTANELIPPDPDRCQAMKPNGNTFMTLGGIPGLEQCRNKPVVIATEIKPRDDGLIGKMSLCAECLNMLLKQLGANYATFEPIIEQKGETKCQE